jgi:mannose-6-phosphate isomerase-like protein (cupin superfamily)
MSAYAKINLLSIKNSSETEGLESHFARKYIESRDIGVSLFRYAPNFQAQGAHSHKVQEEVYVVVHGSGSILLNEEAINITLWDAIRVAPEVVRTFRAGPEGLDILAIGGPKPSEGDGVRQTPHWPAS